MSNRVPNSKRVEQLTTLVVRGRRRIVTLVTRRANSRFDPDDLHGSVIAVPLLERMRRAKATHRPPGGNCPHLPIPTRLAAAAVAVVSYVEQAKSDSRHSAREIAGDRYAQHVFAWLTAGSIRRVVQLDRDPPHMSGAPSRRSSRSDRSSSASPKRSNAYSLRPQPISDGCATSNGPGSSTSCARSSPSSTKEHNGQHA